MLIAFLFVAAVVAFAISTIAGGGAGLMLIPVLALLLPGVEVPAALSIGSATSSLSRIALFRRAIRWDIVRWFLPAALPAAALGAWMLSRFDPMYVKLILGLVLVANLPLLFLPPRGAAEAGTSAARPALLLSLGAAVGLLSGFTGAVGVAFNRIYFRLRLEKAEIVATRAMNEILLHIVKIALYATFGVLTTRSVIAGAVVAAGAISASWVMARILHRIDETLFRRASTMAMVAAGTSMVASAAPAALDRQKAGVAFTSTADERELQAYWGRHGYGLAWSARDGIVLEKRLSLAHLKPRYARALPPTPSGARIVAIEKFAQLDREGLEIHYARGNTRWETVVVTERD